jgi:two-component system response regulator
MSRLPVHVLLVEDSPTDVLLTREALDRAEVSSILHVVDNGVEAMEFLRHQGRYAAVPRPDIILLDLNMPRMNGQEVLVAIKGNQHLKSIPVVILTTSKSPADISRAYAQHANCYVTKPVEFEAFARLIHAVLNFWCNVATLSVVARP